MNKKEKEILSKGENLYFENEDEDEAYEVSAESVSVDKYEKIKKNQKDSIVSGGKKMDKKEKSPNKNSEEKVVDEVLEVKTEELETPTVPEDVPKEEKLPDDILIEPEDVPEEYSEDAQEVFSDENPEDESEAEDESEVEAEDEVEEPDLLKEVERKPPKPPKHPREPDPCPGVSPREHWPILRNRFFVFLLLTLSLGVLVVVLFIGINHGAVSFAPKEAISEEIVAARHELPLSVAYFTGGENNWKTVARWEFSFSEDSPVLWVYLRGGIPYYDEECRNKTPFAGENMGNLKNANSSMGPVSLTEDGVTWIVDKTGEKIFFLSGLKQDLAKEVSSFTAGGAKKPSFSEVTSEKVTTVDVVILPVYPSSSVVFYNDGRSWKSLPINKWDGETSKFEFWNFGYKDSSLRYWDKEMKNSVSPSSSDSGNYFWRKDKDGNDQKCYWNGTEVVPFK